MWETQWLELREGNDTSGFNHRESFLSITALGLLDSVYFCNVLSVGQLPFQISQSCTHNGLLFYSLPCGVMFASTWL
jgi:hypothetical protein